VSNNKDDYVSGTLQIDSSREQSKVLSCSDEHARMPSGYKTQVHPGAGVDGYENAVEEEDEGESDVLSIPTSG
jgi:hypothetical protein